MTNTIELSAEGRLPIEQDWSRQLYVGGIPPITDNEVLEDCLIKALGKLTILSRGPSKTLEGILLRSDYAFIAFETEQDKIRAEQLTMAGEGPRLANLPLSVCPRRKKPTDCQRLMQSLGLFRYLSLEDNEDDNLFVGRKRAASLGDGSGRWPGQSAVQDFPTRPARGRRMSPEARSNGYHFKLRGFSPSSERQTERRSSRSSDRPASLPTRQYLYYHNIVVVSNLPPFMSPVTLYNTLRALYPIAVYIYPYPDALGFRVGEVQFDDGEWAAQAITALHGSWIAGHQVSAQLRPRAPRASQRGNFKSRSRYNSTASTGRTARSERSISSVEAPYLRSSSPAADDSDDLEIFIEGRSISGSPTVASKSGSTRGEILEDIDVLSPSKAEEPRLAEFYPTEPAVVPAAKVEPPSTPTRRQYNSVWALPPERIASMGYVPKPERQIIRPQPLSPVQIQSV